MCNTGGMKKPKPESEPAIPMIYFGWFTPPVVMLNIQEMTGIWDEMVPFITDDPLRPDENERYAKTRRSEEKASFTIIV